MRWQRAVAVSSVGLFVAALAPVLAAPASATVNPTIVVTTTADETDSADGVISLREAIGLANATPGADTIQLAAGADYDLTICDPSSNDNAPDNSKGDLNASDPAGLVISGDPTDIAPPVIHQTCNQRALFDSAGPLAVQHLHLTGGRGGSILAHGALVADHVDVSGVVGIDGDAALYATTRPVSITDSAIHDNTATGVIITGSGSRTDTVIQRSSIRDNTISGSFDAAGIVSQASFTLNHSQVTGNAGGNLSGGIRSFDAYVTNSDISGNTGRITGGILGGFTLIDSTLNNNTAGTTGTGSGGGGGGLFTLVRTTVSGNHSGFAAGGLDGEGSITDSTVSGNTASGAVGGILADANNPPLTPTLQVTRSTITGNTGYGAGGILGIDDWYSGDSGVVHPASVVLSASTVAGNTVTSIGSPSPGDPPTVTDLVFFRWNGEPVADVAGSLSSTASVIGAGGSATPACGLAAASPVTSGGYNFSADSSCVGGGTGDVVAGGDPGLAPLANNGGPTRTMMPAGSSPLVDRIPSAFSTCGGTLDQRGVARPVGPACTIGAVEADRIVVTTTADVIDPADGVLSLREAVALANATPGHDTILLAAGATYDLTRCGADSAAAPDNTVGDLNATDPAGLTISGPTAGPSPTIHQTCPQGIMAASTTGFPSAPGPLVLDHLALVGGDATVRGASIYTDGALALDHVDQSGATGPSGRDAIYTGDVTTIVDSAVHDNATTGIEIHGSSSTSASIERSSVRHNVPIGVTLVGGLVSYGPLTIDHSEIVANGDDTPSTVGVGGLVAEQTATITQSVISGNLGDFVGGILGTFALTDSQVVDNVGLGGGAGSGTFTIERSLIARNRASYQAAGLYGAGSIADSTIAQNVTLNPVTGQPGVGGGIVVDGRQSIAPSLSVRNSTVTGNRGAAAAGITVLSTYTPSPAGPSTPTSVTIVSSTVAGNTLTPLVPGSSPLFTAPVEAADLAFARWAGEPTANAVGALTATSSVFGSGNAAAPSCALGLASPVTSGGYNFGSDASCLTEGPGDVVAGGDPGLSPLADHGGPTATLMPTVGSPLVDRVPAGFSTCAGQVDQRGVARPVGAACDIGSVEADAAVFPTEREFTPIVPQRLMDTRSDPAYHVGTQHRFGQGETETLAVAGGSSPVPADATAVVVNVTAVAPSAASHVDVWPTGSPQPNVSNLNFTPGQTVANLAKVKVGASGAISLFNRNGTVDVIVDVVGYYRNDPTAARYTPIVPHRVADSRADPAYHVGTLTRLGDHGDVRALTVTGGTTGVPVGATAIIANVTAVDPTAASHLDVWPAGTAHPNVSNINYTAGQTVPNLVVVKVSADGTIDLANANGSADVIVDIVGYFTVDPAAAGFVATVPRRLIDTRANPAYHVGAQTRLGDRNDPRTVTVTGGVIPNDATAIVANITVVDPSTASHLDVWPAGTAHPNVSNLNYTAGQTVANLVTIKIGTNGAIDLVNQNGSTDVIIDIVGYYR